MKNRKQIKKIEFNYDLLPILFLICIVPFIIRFTLVETGLEDYTYFPYEMASHGDFFLYFRSRVIMGVALVMLVVLGDIFLLRRQMKRQGKVWVFAVVYILVSAYKSDCVIGMMEQYESILA